MNYEEPNIKVDWLRLIAFYILPVLVTIVLFIGIVYGLYVPTIRTNLLEAKKETVKEVVSGAYSLIDYNYRLSQETQIPRQELQTKITAMLTPYRFGKDQKNYFWIVNFDKYVVMHPMMPEITDTLFEGTYDEEGVSSMTKILEKAKQSPEGFVEYDWYQPDKKLKLKRKMSYVKVFEPWGWVIGSGVFIEDVEKEIQSIVDRTNEVLSYVLIAIIFILGFVVLQSARGEEDLKSALETVESNEKKYRELVETANSIILKMDTQGNVTFLNEYAQMFFGFTNEELLGRNVIGTIVPEMESDTGRDLQEMIVSIGKNPEMYRNNANENLTKQGRKVWVSWTNRPIFNEKNLLAGVLCVGNDITARKKVEDELQRKTKSLKLLNDKLRYLYQHIYDIRDDERRVIAREIHDELGQLMTAIRMDISMLEKEVADNQEERSEKFTDVYKLIDTTVDSVRRISGSLHPSILDDLGLVAAVEWLLESFQKRSGIFCEKELPSTDIPKGAHDIVLFRALQEALTNVSRHAKATLVYVKLQHLGDRLSLHIKDNGVGLSTSIQESRKSLGLIGMRERIDIMGGTVEIKGEPDKGTEINITVPVRS